MTEGRVYTELHWSVRIELDGDAWHSISGKAVNLGARNRAELSGLRLGLPRVGVDSFQGRLGGDVLESGDLYVPELAACVIDLEKHIDEQSPSEISFFLKFRQAGAVERADGRRVISLIGYDPSGLLAISIEHSVCIPSYATGWQRAFASLYYFVGRRGHQPQGLGVTLRDPQPESADEGCFFFSPPPTGNAWAHRFEYDWLDISELRRRVLSSLFTLVAAFVVGVIAGVVSTLIVQIVLD